MALTAFPTGTRAPDHLVAVGQLSTGAMADAQYRANKGGRSGSAAGRCGRDRGWRNAPAHTQLPFAAQRNAHPLLARRSRPQGTTWPNDRAAWARTRSLESPDRQKPGAQQIPYLDARGPPNSNGSCSPPKTVVARQEAGAHHLKRGPLPQSKQFPHAVVPRRNEPSRRTHPAPCRPCRSRPRCHPTRHARRRAKSRIPSTVGL